MKNDINLPKKRLKEAGWRTHYAEWEKSSLSKTAYCLANNLIATNFYYWCKRIRDEKVQELQAFVPVTTQSANTSSGSPSVSLQVYLPNHIKLNMDVPMNHLLDFIRGLSDGA